MNLLLNAYIIVWVMLWWISNYTSQYHMDWSCVRANNLIPQHKQTHSPT